MAIDGVPKELALRLARAAGITWFVETGTYKGDTAKWAAGEFERVVTIEAHKPRYTKTKAALGKIDNIKICYGDSRTRLKKELDRLGDAPAMLWLDAHWCGNYELSAGTPGECPLIDELAAVRANDIVLIDDARLFLEPPPRPHDPKQWPDMAQIRRGLPGRFVRIVGDVIIAVPLRHAEIVRQHIGERDGPRAAVLTSNKYVNCLPAFAYLWLKYIGQGIPATVVRYDVRPPALPKLYFSQFAIGNQADYSWSSGVHKFCQWWPFDLVLVMLEDYWIASANAEELRLLWEHMQQNPQISKLDLTGDRLKVPYTEYPKIGPVEVVQSAGDANFRASVQAAIWRTDYLRECSAKGDWTAWQFEKHAAQNDGALILGVKEPVINYVNAVGGEGRRPGEYDRKKIPNWMWQELAEKGLVK